MPLFRTLGNTSVVSRPDCRLTRNWCRICSHYGRGGSTWRRSFRLAVRLISWHSLPSPSAFPALVPCALFLYISTFHRTRPSALFDERSLFWPLVIGHRAYPSELCVDPFWGGIYNKRDPPSDQPFTRSNSPRRRCFGYLLRRFWGRLWDGLFQESPTGMHGPPHRTFALRDNQANWI